MDKDEEDGEAEDGTEVRGIGEAPSEGCEEEEEGEKVGEGGIGTMPGVFGFYRVRRSVNWMERSDTG